MDKENIIQTTTRVLLTIETESIYEAPKSFSVRQSSRKELKEEIDAMWEPKIPTPTLQQLSPAQLSFYGNAEFQRFLETGERPSFDVEALLADIPDEIIVG